MKRMRPMILAALLLCCALLSACGSGRRTETVHIPTPTQTAPVATPTPAPTPTPPSAAEQRALIERSRSQWEWQSPYETWFYAYCDMDHNGRLEVLTASLQGTGLYTYVKCWEVSADYTRLVPCPDNTGEGQAWPDIIQEMLPGYYDPASGRFTYLCDDYVRDGAARYYLSKTSFSLGGGALTLNWYAYMEEVHDDAGNVSRNYHDAAGNTLTQEQFEAAATSAFTGLETANLYLTWTKVEPEPVVTPAAPPVITKHPTGESIAVGGKAWFIAHADNADTLTWELVSPEGRAYSISDAMAVNPGLRLQALEGDTIAVSNAPLSVNGWGVRARFDGPGGSAVTNAARLTVTSYEEVYASILAKYRAAYRDGNTFPEYAYDNGISEFIGYSAHAGYALEDLDGDGVPELLIAGIGNDNFSNGVLYDLYTVSDGEVLQVACSRVRDRFYLRNDGSILNEGSGGAGYSVFILNWFQDGGLLASEVTMSYFGMGSDGYYHITDGFRLQPRSTDTPISEVEFNYLVGSYEDGITVPELTLIA